MSPDLVAAPVSPWDCRVVADDALAAQGYNAKATCATLYASPSFRASAAYMQHKPSHRIPASNSTVTAAHAHFLASHSGPLSGFTFRTYVCGRLPARPELPGITGATPGPVASGAGTQH